MRSAAILSIALACLVSLLLLPLVHAVSPTLTYSTAHSFSVSTATKVSGDDQFGVGYSDCFALDGVNSPRLILTRGVTYTFTSTTAPLHPFYLTSDSVGAGGGTKYLQPITTNNQATTWTADPNGAGTLQLYYNCGVHGQKKDREDKPMSM